jgi:hypothetical protein
MAQIFDIAIRDVYSDTHQSTLTLSLWMSGYFTVDNILNNIGTITSFYDDDNQNILAPVVFPGWADADNLFHVDTMEFDTNANGVNLFVTGLPAQRLASKFGDTNTISNIFSNGQTFMQTPSGNSGDQYFATFVISRDSRDPGTTAAIVVACVTTIMAVLVVVSSVP